ncbi:MAG: transglycosylase SLT domain-containing protein [Allosphingosinicella sp.]
MTGKGLGAGDRVTGAIQLAAARTGVDFGYLLNQAKVESGLNPNAKAKTSSATGLFQFIEQTWLATVKKHGDAHGLGWAAASIRRGANGRFTVADPQLRRQILDLRRQPEAASAMAGEFAADNRAYLEGRLGRPVEGVDLYLAHFLGPAGAARFLKAHDANPDGSAAAMLPAAARANRWVFYGPGGAPRSFAQIRERFADKIGGDALPATAPRPAPGLPLDPFAVPEIRTADLDFNRDRPAGPSPEYARLAYLMLAQLGG